MSRAFAAPMTWIWLMAGSLALACFAALYPFKLAQAAPVGMSAAVPLVLTGLLVTAAQGLGGALGWRHGWAAGLALAGSLAAVPALSLRSEVHAHAAQYQADDTAWPTLRPLGHVALLSCLDECTREARHLMDAGAYSVFIAGQGIADFDSLPPEFKGVRLRDCGQNCQRADNGDLAFNDIAYWRAEIATPEDRYVTGLTRHVLLRQSEGEWTEIARDTTVHYRTPGLWSGFDTLPGKLTGLTTAAGVFDLSGRP